MGFYWSYTLLLKRSILMHPWYNTPVPVDADLMKDVLGLVCWVILIKGDKELGQGLRL